MACPATNTWPTGANARSAARRCKAAGFDGVEVWAAYHGLLDQFWTPFSNTRDDRWGGNPENRTRFSRAICHRFRRVCGADFIIGLAVSDDSDVEAALGRESMAEIVALHDGEQAMDYVTCGVGSYFDFYKLMPTFLYGEKLGVDLARTLKGVVSHARVTAEAGIRTPEKTNTVLGAAEADLVSIVRGQIAGPHLVNKARDGRGGDVRGCISCNQQCWGRRSRDYWISGLVNPSAGREWEWGGDRFTTAQTAKSVRVVGAGPAGLEAARAAAERGHRLGALAEAGHAVTVLTPDALTGKELQRSATDHPLRRNLARLGAEFVTKTAGLEWTRQGAVVLSLLTGQTRTIAADARVMATANHADMGLSCATIWRHAASTARRSATRGAARATPPMRSTRGAARCWRCEPGLRRPPPGARLGRQPRRPVPPMPLPILRPLDLAAAAVRLRPGRLPTSARR